MAGIRVLAALAFASLAVAAEPDQLTIRYTGRLLGYARQPDIQRAIQSGWRVNGEILKDTPQVAQRCASGQAFCQPLYQFLPAGPSCSLAAAILGSLIRGEKTPGSECKPSPPHDGLLLGMGDNFAMDYFSRVVVAQMPGPNKEEKLIPKDALFFDAAAHAWIDLRDFRGGPAFKAIERAESTGNTEIPEDNVARFFSSAGYDALVPGKHDFYFGPERLRQLARLLAGGGNGGTRMLGANLVIQSKAADPPVELDERLRVRRRNFETKVQRMSWSLPKIVLPWMRSFKLGKYKDREGKPLVDLKKPATLCLTEDRDQTGGAECLEMSAAPAPVPGSTEDLIYRIADPRLMLSERTYLICAPLRPPKHNEEPRKPSLCAPFDVTSPFFEYPDLAAPGYLGNRKLPGGGIAARSGAKPLRPWVKKEGAVVMGVVEPGLEARIGWLNTAYISENEKYDTFVSAVDPAEALNQVLDYCRETGDCSSAIRLVLMAQMPREQAEVLNDRLGRQFSVVLAEADRRFVAPALSAECPSDHCRVVLVPRGIMGKNPDDIRDFRKGVQLDVASLTGLPSHTRLTTSASERFEIPDAHAGGACLREQTDSAWKQATGERDFSNEPDPAARFHTVVLHAMREAFRTDVALIQERDFFDLEQQLKGCPDVSISGANVLRGALEQVLWKGDFAVSRTITGAALKAALAESDRLKNVAESSYRVEPEDRDWLDQLGLWQDADTKAWYVNGRAIEDKATYSVATTDHLVSGDTGYATLRDPAVPPPPRPRELKHLYRLSDLVLARLNPAQAALPLEASMYLDHLKHEAFIPAPAADAGHQADALVIDAIEQRPKLDTSRDRLGQNRSYWRLVIDKGEIGFSDYNHDKGTQDELKKQFAATSESGVLAAKATNLPLALQFELRRERPRDHFFSRTELDFSLSNTQKDDASGRRLTTYPANKVSVESGYRFAFFPARNMRSRPWVAGLASAYAETTPVQPVGSFNTKVTGCTAVEKTTCPDTLSFASPLPRTSRLLAKLGVRAENGQNWGEAGLFAGKVSRPAEFAVLQNGVPIPAPDAAGICRLADLFTAGQTTSLKDCLENNFRANLPSPADQDAVSRTLDLRGQTASKPETGIFVNFTYSLPVPKNGAVKDIALEQRGSWFFNHSRDTVVDARIIERFSVGPNLTVIPSFPGITLKPTYTLFLYKNKVAGNQLLGRTFDIKLEYRFDWKSGASWGQVLRYGRPK